MLLNRYFLSLFFLLLLSHGIFAEAIESSPVPDPVLKTRSGMYRLGFESVTLPTPGERMGLMGFNYLLNLTPYFYGGIGGYGAMTGDQGGFITGGFEGGLHFPILDRLSGEGGLFLGGGGGRGVTNQGGGLMIRPHAGLIYDFGSYQVGIVLSKVKFPNGLTDSDQIGITLDFPLTALFSENREMEGKRFNLNDYFSKNPQELSEHLGLAPEDILILYQTYLLHNNAYDTSGRPLTESMKLLGAELRYYSLNRFYALLEMAAETGGNRDGYAEIFFGAGYRYTFESMNSFALSASLAAGSGGGGGLDTGGGALAKVTGGVEYKSGRFKAELEGGYLKSLSGTPDAPLIGLEVGYETDALTYQKEVSLIYPDENVTLTGWRFRAAHETYFNPQRKTGLNVENIELIGLKADRMLSENLYLTGQAYSAYSGNAGGYSAGLIGAGWESSVILGTDNQFKLELVLGAGGGGAITVGGGAIVEPRAGIIHNFSPNFSAEVTGGKIRSISGDLNSATIDLTLAYHFARLEINH